MESYIREHDFQSHFFITGESERIEHVKAIVETITHLEKGLRESGEAKTEVEISG